MPNTPEETNPASTQGKQQPILRFKTRGEVTEYLDSTAPKQPNDSSKRWAPWKETVTETKPEPRNGMTLYAEYVITSSLSQAARQDNSLSEYYIPIILHNGYDVAEDAPDNIKSLALELRKSMVELSPHLAVLKFVKKQLDDGNHPLQEELKKAEQAEDFSLAQIRNAEITKLKQQIEKDISNYTESIELAKDKQKWESKMKDKAALFKRFNELKPIVNAQFENSDNTTEANAEFLRRADILREYDNLLASGLFVPGNQNLILYLYHHPETESDKRFAPTD